MNGNKTRIRIQGNSRIITIPAKICEMANLKKDIEMRIEAINGNIVMSPIIEVTKKQ